MGYKPIGQNLSFAKGGDVDITPCVTHLHERSRPPNITFFVVSVIVNAVKRMFGGRSATNLFKKMLVGLKPKFYTTSAVISVLFKSWVIATIFRSLIRPVFRRRLAVDTMSMPDVALLVQASTRAGVVVAQGIASPRTAVSAITNAVPHGSVIADTREADSQQASEALTCKHFNSPFTQRGRIYSKIVGRHCVKESPLMYLASRVVESYRFLQPAFILA